MPLGEIAPAVAVAQLLQVDQDQSVDAAAEVGIDAEVEEGRTAGEDGLGVLLEEGRHLQPAGLQGRAQAREVGLVVIAA